MTLRMNRLLITGVFCFLCWLLFSCDSSQQSVATLENHTGTPGLTIKVVDAETDLPLPSRLVIRDDQQKLLTHYYKNLPGTFSDSLGMYVMDLEPGTYAVEIFHGIDYLSCSQTVNIPENKHVILTAKMQPWVDLKERGWINGDGHAHLYTDTKRNTAMLDTLRQICVAQGVDFLSTNQGWAGYDDASWMAGYEKYSDEQFLLTYGAEMPKYRTGHIWWLGLSSTRSYFSAAMDSMYENLYYKSEKRKHWNFREVPFKNIPSVYLVPQMRKAENAVAIIPHPTSWWWQDEKYVTNVCENLAFGLLAGDTWDGMVVMGYNADHYFYQNLWFSVLNQGYTMPALAELDGGYGKNNKFPYGKFRTYFFTDGELTIDAAADAVRKGQTFATSGPIVLATMDKDRPIGSKFPADGQPHKLRIKAFASGDAEEFLSYVIVFRNGKIFKLWDVRQKQIRKFSAKLSIKETERAWYAVKAVGKTSIENPDLLEVMQVCENITAGTFAQGLDMQSSVCITSPFYFGEFNTQILPSRVSLKLVDPETGDWIKGGFIEIVKNGKVLKNMLNLPKALEFNMPVNAVLRITLPGYPVIHRGLFLDYEPHAKMIEQFANGDWLKIQGLDHLGPGQVPWQMFQIVQTRELLRDVEWTIPVQQNERDHLWADFYERF